MKLINKIFTIIILVSLAFACETDKDMLYSFDYLSAPANVSAVFDITQDNTGLVSVTPNADGAQTFTVEFGDSSGGSSESLPGETVTHTYVEGSYDVNITAFGLTGLSTKAVQNITVSFKAPENLAVTITKNDQNPRIVTVLATADFATVFEVYFGDVADEEPVLVLPGVETTHTYENPGDYDIHIIAKSAGAATTEYTETVNIPAASDPVNLPIDFESFTINYAFVDFGNVGSSVIDNPDASEINTSDKVAQSVKANGAETWGGSFLTLENPIDFSVNTTFKVKVWSPKVGAVVKLKVENLTDGAIGAEVDAVTTVGNAWEELTYDFSEIDTNNEYQKVVIFFDFGNVGDGSTYYFDDIKLVPASIPAFKSVQDFEGDAPTFTVFGNIAAIEVVANPDQSGENTTATTAKMTKSAGSETWAGSFFELESALDLENYDMIKVKTWSPKSGIVVKLKLENLDASITHEVDVINTTANAWEELTYDFSEAPTADYVKVVIFFDFGNSGDDSVYYYDEIGLANDGATIPPMGFQDFEGDAPTFTTFGNIADIEVIANPDQTGANTTATVAQLIKTSGAETWAGSFFELGAALDLNTYSKIQVRIWSPKSGVVVKLKLENQDASITHEVDMNTTTENAWEIISYDFSGASAADYVRVVIFFDFGNSGDDSVYYYDEFELTI